MKYHKITSPDIENGLGFRVTLWISGCKHNCPQCHNPETHNCLSGREFTEDSLMELFEKLDKSYIKGLTLSGGDPAEFYCKEVIDLIEKVKTKFPEKDIWMYSGYTYEELLENPLKKNLLTKIDILVDGKFIVDQRDVSIAFRGSRNQRIIDVQESLKQGKVILYIK